MLVPSTADLLGVWERGMSRHPIDRALLLAAWARPDEPPDRLADLPLGAVNEALLRLREAWFGTPIRAYADCAACGERTELSLDPAIFAFPPAPAEAEREVAVSGVRFRPPSRRDLAAIAAENDAERAALLLLERCCLERPASAPANLVDLLGEVEAKLEALDPAAEIALSLVCGACGEPWAAPFDIAALLWDDVDAHARKLVGEVDALARVYGWTEPQILALSPQRRATYLAMVQG
jgi:hypothetical protein